MEVICINASFSPEVLEFFRLNKISMPVVDKIYNIRDVIKPSVGQKETGFLLEEIRNPKVHIKHPILGLAEVEPNFSSKRFTKLSGEPISSEEIKEILKTTKTIT